MVLVAVTLGIQSPVVFPFTLERDRSVDMIFNIMGFEIGSKPTQEVHSKAAIP